MNKRERKSKKSKRDVKPVFRIYTEGEKTEINYIRGYICDYLKQKEYLKDDIKPLKPKSHTPYGLFQTAKSEKLPNDIVWLVFDRDAHPKLPETFTEARDANIQIAYSSICVETWILLHFTYSTKPFSCCDEIKKHLHQYFDGDYDKALTNLYQTATGEFGERLDSARQNAARLCAAMISANHGRQLWELNPYTNVHELLDAIDLFIKEKNK